MNNEVIKATNKNLLIQKALKKWYPIVHFFLKMGIARTVKDSQQEVSMGQWGRTGSDVWHEKLGSAARSSVQNEMAPEDRLTQSTSKGAKPWSRNASHKMNRKVLWSYKKL